MWFPQQNPDAPGKACEGYKPLINRKKELEMQGQVVCDESQLLKSEKPTVMRIGLHARQYSKEESNGLEARSQQGAAEPYNKDFVSCMEEALSDNVATVTSAVHVPHATNAFSTPQTLPVSVAPDSLPLLAAAIMARPNPGVFL